MSTSCPGICSGSCVYNPAKMRTECAMAADAKCTGLCGAGCDIQCGAMSSCNVNVAAGGAFECKGGTCGITVEDPSATVECTQAGTVCNIVCKGDCRYECSKGAACTVQCGSGPAMMVTTDGTCPPTPVTPPQPDAGSGQ
jgi:hypothetical protein